jgi:hypothetical protein
MITSKMRAFVFLSALFLCACAQAQAPPGYSPDFLKQPDFSPGPLKKIEGLNSAQQQAVDDYVQKGERRTGELKVLADRNGIALVASEALRKLFPDCHFVAVPWVYQADPQAMNKYSIPEILSFTLVLDENGKNAMPARTGYLEEYGQLLHAEKIKITDEGSAVLVRSALSDIYGFGMGDKNVRHSESQWYVGYRENPFRAISSYEEVREASYYLVTTDSEGVVKSGRLVNEVLERRKIDARVPSGRQ